jgi:phage tail-like protein
MDRRDPYANFRFRVEIDGIQQASFSECTGLGASIEVLQYREGGDPITVRKLPGKVNYPEIKLKWGITDSKDLYSWFMDAVQGKIHRKNLSVILIDTAGDDKVRWNFSDAWPSAYSGPDFNATKTEVAIESLTLVYERAERVD